MKYHCLFEQSGTFKNEFKKLGFEAYDYDILNQLGETDYVVDLYKEIENAYAGGVSIFDDIEPNDQILAFFPCTRFENQALLQFRGDNSGMKNWSKEQKLEYDIKHHSELHRNYLLITKLAIISIKKNVPLIIENPYSTQHYLQRYWCLKPSLIDFNRRDRGDYFEKPTQYWFVNREPSNNFIFEAQVIKPLKTISNVKNQVERSMISKEYANRFIREFIL